MEEREEQAHANYHPTQRSLEDRQNDMAAVNTSTMAGRTSELNQKNYQFHRSSGMMSCFLQYLLLLLILLWHLRNKCGLLFPQTHIENK
jgi:hypothetical protein